MPDTQADPGERLRVLLHGPPPDSVAALSDADRTALADVLDEALRRQDESVLEAFTATLKHVPFPLRKVVKKVLMG